MRVLRWTTLRWAAMVLALTAGYFATPRAASAAALPTAGLAATGASDANALVSDVRWRRHGGWHRGRHYGRHHGWRRAYYRPRHYYRSRYYRPRYYHSRRFYGPRVVCRVRYTAWGPRRVCFRRF